MRFKRSFKGYFEFFFHKLPSMKLSQIVYLQLLLVMCCFCLFMCLVVYFSMFFLCVLLVQLLICLFMCLLVSLLIFLF